MRIQRVLDALEFSQCIVKTDTWDLVAWNCAASALIGYEALASEQRNILRRVFFDSQFRAVQLDWQSVARYAVAAFRADIARAGASANVQELVDELRRLSPEFEMMWRENDGRTHCGGTKKFRNPVAGLLGLG